MPGPAEQSQRKWEERAGERDFQQLAMEVPAFAGFFYASPGSDTLVVAVASAAEGERARAATARLMARKRNLPRGQLLVVRQVRYSFLQLDGWRALVEERLLGRPEVTAVDLDELRNALGIGVDEGQSPAGVDAIMAAAGIPRNAYYVMTFPGCRNDSCRLRRPHPPPPAGTTQR